MMKLYLTFLCVIFAFFVSCGDEKEGDGSSKETPTVLVNSKDSVAFLTPASFEEGKETLTVLSETDLKSEINKLKVFVANREKEEDSDSGTEDSSNTDEASQACFQNTLDNASFGSGDTLKIELKGDFAECINKKAAEQEAQFFKAHVANMQIFSEFKCEGVDFSTVSKDSIFESALSEQLSACTSASKTSLLANSRLIMDMEIYLFGKNRVQIESTSATHQKDGSACERVVEDGKVVYKTECLRDKKQIKTGQVGDILNGNEETEGNTDEDKEEIIASRVILPSGLIKPENGTYYENVSIEFSINEWSGTMTYTDSETAPTWTATNGTETLTGTLNPK
ncbi:MAG: hypothetical protein R3B45_08445 [Bdellovibrionota bacterium]